MQLPKLDKLTPQDQLMGRDAALEALGLTRKQKHVDWLERHWQGELKWNERNRKNVKGYSPELIERLKS